MGKTLKVIGLAGLFILALVLRKNNYATVPRPGESLDEYAFAWSGLGLLRLGVPIGWSLFESTIYKPDLKYINVDNIYRIGTVFANPFYIQTPWLDHPPGMGLLTGGFAYANGARVLADTSVRLIRKPMVILGAVSVVMLALVGWAYFDYLTGFVAGLIYAVSPFVVVSSRLPQAENAYILFFLLAMLMLRRYKGTKKQVWFWLSAIAAGMGIWFKIPAVVITMTAAAMLLPNFQDAIKYAFISLSWGLGPVLAYGLAIDPETFGQVMFMQSQRFYGLGPAAVWHLFTQTKITAASALTDGWMLLGWLSWGIVAATERVEEGKKLVATAVFVNLFSWLMLGSEPFGWYLFPLWPWLVLAIAVLLRRSLNSPNVVVGILALGMLVPLGVLVSKFLTKVQFSNYATGWRFFVGVYFLTLAAVIVYPKFSFASKVMAILVWAVFGTCVWLSIKYVMGLDGVKWLVAT